MKLFLTCIYAIIRGDYFQFGSVFIKKVIKSKLKKPKPVQTNQFKPVWLGFFSLDRFGFVFFRFGSIFVFSGLGSVQFFRFQTYKTETKPVIFFKI
jgi:hypothetical protein